MKPISIPEACDPGLLWTGIGSGLIGLLPKRRGNWALMASGYVILRM
jgi:hypothetical protein